MPDSACNPDRLHDLISRHADGLITPTEHRALTAALTDDPAARKQWFLRNDIDIAVASRRVERQDRMPATDAAGGPDGGLTKRFRAATLAGPALAVLGVAVGVFGASAVWAFAVPRSAFSERAVRVFAESFERGREATVPALPRGLNDPAADAWRGDEATVVVARQGVRPAHGGRMLAFERSTFAGEDPSASAWSDVYRLVDVRPFFPMAGGRPAAARLAASFAVAPDAWAAGESYSANVQVYAFDRDISDAPEPLPLGWVRENCVASGMKRVPLERGQRGWKRVSVDASLPPEAAFLLVHVAVARVTPGPTSEPAVFRGHFLDDVTIELHSHGDGR